MLKKIIGMLTMVFLISGCSIKYELEFTKDLKIKENITVMEKNTEFDRNGTTNKIYINSIYDVYKNNNNYKQYVFQKKYNKENSGIKATTEEQTIDDYLKNNKVKKTLFGEINIENYDNKIILHTYDYRGETFFNSEDIEDFYRDEVKIIIKTPFKVYQHNADEANIKKGLYIWNFNDKTLDKNIEIIFKDNLSIKEKINIYISQYYTYVLIFILVIIVPTITIIMKHKQVNKI